MAIKKTELYASLWQSCDELRGGMDASQYKDYILTLLFVKYVSDKYTDDPYGLIDIPEGGSFADIVRLKGDKEIGDKINKIIGRLAEANDLKKVIDLADFNDEDKLGKGDEMKDRLSKLVAIFDDLDLSANRAEGDDLLGDAYEYLMRHFATESGKSKGQFYTPAEVSRVLAKVVGISEHTRQDQTVYDPACGSGSLLLKVADEAPRGLSIYGQEMDNATFALARMNMILHDHPTAEMWQANTLAAPYWRNEVDGGLQTFDFAVANPPFSYKSWSNGLKPHEDEFDRFEYGIPPAKNGDYAFLLHILKSLKSTGKAAVILPHGVLFRGNTEADIRRNLIKQGFIKGIIGLPPNLFYGTGIPACIIVIDKADADERDAIFMIDASRGFSKDGNKNRLRERDIHKIVDVFNKQLVLPRYSRLVPLWEIEEEHDYNLNIPRYIDSSEPEDIHDLGAHLNGGIPQGDIDGLDDYWQLFPSLRRTLFQPMERKGYSELLVAAGAVKGTMLRHPEFQDFKRETMQRYLAWRNDHTDRLRGLAVGDNPKALIFTLSEDLLARFAGAALMDKYGVYQLLLDYWAEAMQDDVYLIVQDGWKAGGQLRELVATKQKKKETPDLVLDKKKYKADLIPPALLIARFFAAEQAAVERLLAEQEGLAQEIESFVEERSGDEDILAGVLEGSKKIKRADVLSQIDAYETIALQAFAPAILEEMALAEDDLALATMLLSEFERVPENGSYLNPLRNKQHKLTKTAVNKQLKALNAKEDDPNDAERVVLQGYLDGLKEIAVADKQCKQLRQKRESELAAIAAKHSDSAEMKDLADLSRLLKLIDAEKAVGDEAKAQQRSLDEAVFARYPKLSVDEIQTLVIADKWGVTLERAIAAEVERVTQRLAGRVTLLAERYAEPLPQLVDKVVALSCKVEAHLRRMGVAW